MTIFRNRQYKKRTSIQRKLIYSIAIEGHLSKPKAVKRITSYYANVHEAFKTLEEDKIIQFSYTNLKSRRAEWYFKLTHKGFLEFIEQTPSPYEFWTAGIWSCGLRKGSVNKDEFERYWNLYLHKYIGSTFLNGCFFHHDFLENLFGEWRNNIWDTHKIKTDKIVSQSTGMPCWTSFNYDWANISEDGISSRRCKTSFGQLHYGGTGCRWLY